MQQQHVKQEKYILLTIVLLLVKFLIPLTLIPSDYEFHRDEFLYLSDGQHLDWGYFENPPLIALLSRICALFGNSTFIVRFWPALFGALTLWIVLKIVREVGGTFWAELLAGTAMIFSVFLRINYLYQPNFLDIFFWTLSALFLVKYFNTQNNKYLLWLGVAFGLGLESKFMIGIFIISLMLGILFTINRKIFFKKYIYLAALIAFLIYLPNFIWQTRHHFPIFYQYSELSQSQLQFLSSLDFVTSQFLMNLATLPVFIAGLIFLFFVQNGKKYRALGWSYLLVILLLFLARGKSYYTLGAYPVLFAFGARQLEFLINRKKRWWIAVVVLAWTAFIMIDHFPIALPIFKPQQLADFYREHNVAKLGVLRWEDGKDHALPQDFADMLGWREITERTANSFHALPDSEKNNTIIYCDNYGEAGAINLYGKHDDLPTALSNSASFLFWLPDDLNFKNVLMVTPENPFPKDSVENFFEDFEVLDSVRNPLAREFGTKIIFFKNVRPEALQHFNSDFKKQKRQFGF